MATQAYNDSQPVNLGTGYEISIRNLITLICELMEFNGAIVYETDKPNGQPRRCLDTERAKLAFDFTTQVDFKQGLRNTIDWYRNTQAKTPVALWAKERNLENSRIEIAAQLWQAKRAPMIFASGMGDAPEIIYRLIRKNF